MTTSIVASDKQILDKQKLVSVTNRIQAVCILLSNDELVPSKAREYYEQANELLIKAMREAL